MNLQPKKLLLIDSVGALVSALMLSQVLAGFEPVFGMPRYYLYILAFIAAGFFVYSLLSFLIGKDHASLLRIIAIANLMYCLVTLGLVIWLYSLLTVWGLAYFLAEILIIVALARLELKVGTMSPA